MTKKETAMSKLSTLHDLFIEELKDLYSAEQQITKALPKMAKKATSPELRRAFENHLTQTEGHVTRLEQVFESLEEKPKGKLCKGMQGLLEEGEEMMKEDAAPEVMDAALISVAQRVEHYEIAGYGTVCTYADEMGHTVAKSLLGQTLNEEEITDKTLTQLAEQRVNRRAMQPALV
jgi:ferritin-like metal-binding protein YciE